MRFFKFVIFSIAVFFVACTERPEMEVKWHKSAAMPSPRACAACFVVDDQAYFFAGRDSAGAPLNDLWRYTPSTDSWDNLGTTPLGPRVNATACVHEGKVYIGLGFNGKYSQDNSYLRDWWEYSPATNSWQQLSDYPNHYTDDATSFVDDGALYVGYGFCWNYRRDMFRYDIARDRWDSIDVNVSFHGYPTRSFGGTGCTCQGRHFMGTGFYRHSLNWWAELVDGQQWEKRAEVPGPTRTLAASTATKRSIYLSGGIHYGGGASGEVLQDVRRYDPENDRWHYIALLPQRICNHCAFTIGKRVYIGLGEDDKWIINENIYWFEE